MKPIIKWAGGKRQLADKILSLAPEKFGAYHEPFVGGAAVFLALREKVGSDFPAYLSDTLSPLVRCYQDIQLQWEIIAKQLHALIYLYNNDEDKARFYLATRKFFNSGSMEESQAAFFLFLNKTCFNGLWRVNAKGEMNVPYGKPKKPAFPSREDIRQFSEAVKTCGINCFDFRIALDIVTSGDFVYCDPPYDTETGEFTSYSGSFGWVQQQALATTAWNLIRRGATVILSNRATDRIVELYEREYNFEIHYVDQRHSVGAKGDRRRSVREIIAVGRP